MMKSTSNVAFYALDPVQLFSCGAALSNLLTAHFPPPPSAPSRCCFQVQRVMDPPCISLPNCQHYPACWSIGRLPRDHLGPAIPILGCPM